MTQVQPAPAPSPIPPAAGLRRRRKRRQVRFNVGLSALFLPVVMVTGITVAVVSYRHALGLVTDLNRERLSALASSMDYRLRGRLRLATAVQQIQALSDLADPQPFERQVQRLKVLRQALAATPAISSYYLGYGTGERLQLRRIQSEVDRGYFRLPPDTAYLAQIGSRDGAGQVRTQQVLLDAKFRPLAIRPDPLSAGFDPRQRPWYRAATTSRGPTATSVYRFEVVWFFWTGPIVNL